MDFWSQSKVGKGYNHGEHSNTFDNFLRPRLNILPKPIKPFFVESSTEHLQIFCNKTRVCLRSQCFFGFVTIFQLNYSLLILLLAICFDDMCDFASVELSTSGVCVALQEMFKNNCKFKLTSKNSWITGRVLQVVIIITIPDEIFWSCERHGLFPN